MSNNDVFVGTYGGGIFLTTDNGDSWMAKDLGLPKTCINCLSISDFNIFVGTDNSGIFLSTDNGDSWKAINNGLTNLTINTLGIQGKYILAGTNGSGIFRAKLSDFINLDIHENTTVKSLSLFPNPVSDYMELSFPNNISTEIKIYNELGIPVFEKKIQDENNLKIDTRDYAPGVYFCQIKAGRYVETKKFIVIK